MSTTSPNQTNTVQQNNADEIDLGKLFGILLDNIWHIVAVTGIFAVFGIAYALLATYKLLRQYDLFQPLFPLVSKFLTEDGSSNCDKFIEIALENTDRRINSGKRVTPAYLYAAMLWYPLEALAEERVVDSGLNYQDAMLLAMNDALDSQIKTIAIPRRFTATIRDIWHLQGRLPRRQGKRAEKVFEHLKL